MPPLRHDVVRRFRPLAELVPARWVTGTVTAHDGTRLRWTDTAGGGPPVILVHGLQSAGLSWTRTALALEGRYRVLLPDLRGHGASGRITSPVSTRSLAADVATVSDALGLERPFVVGHSLGADVGGVLAAERDLAAEGGRRRAGGRGLRGLVLVDPPVRDMTAVFAVDIDDPPPWVQAIVDTLRALRNQPHHERMVTGLGLLPPGAPADWDEVDYVGYVDGQAQFDPAVFRSAARLERLVDAPDRIAAIRCPVLLLTADPLPGVDLERAVQTFTGHWTHGRHVHVAGSGHAIHYDQFDRFIALLTGFLRRHA